MLAQRLRHRIDIQAVDTETDTSNSDANGAIDQAWPSILAPGELLIAAEIRALTGDEIIEAGTIAGKVNTRITIWHRDGLTPSMRAVHGDVIYDIRAILPDPTQRRFDALLCWTGPNEG